MEIEYEDIKLTIRAKDENHIYALERDLKRIYGKNIEFESITVLNPSKIPSDRNRVWRFITFWHIHCPEGGSSR